MSSIRHCIAAILVQGYGVCTDCRRFQYQSSPGHHKFYRVKISSISEPVMMKHHEAWFGPTMRECVINLGDNQMIRKQLSMQPWQALLVKIA